MEGAEYYVLKGALATLCRGPKPVWLLEIGLDEFHPEGCNPDFQQIFQLFLDHGYQAFTAAADPKSVQPVDVANWVDNGHAGSGTFNYVFAESEDILRR